MKSHTYNTITTALPKTIWRYLPAFPPKATKIM